MRTMEEAGKMERTEQTAPDWFAAPQSRFRPAAYWFWHSLPSPDEMRAQLTDFRDKGYGTILIQARLALPRSVYLSPAFLQAYAQAVAIMGDLGLTAGLYDDYNWTSGQAGGRTVEGADHLRERHLFWAAEETPTGEIDGIEAPFAAALGPDIADWLYDGGVPRFGDWQRVAALLHPVDAPSPDLILDVSDRVRIVGTDEGCRFSYDGQIPKGWRLTVFASARCLTSRLINYLLPEAGQRFVDVGLQPYADALGRLMPKPLEFLFFDQPGPGFYRWRQQTGNLGNSPLYAPLLEAAVETASGTAFGTVLLSLVTDLGPSTARLRCLFYGTYTRLMYDGFFQPLKAFARRHGLSLTGHEILPHVGSFALNGGFSSIDPRVTPAVDFFGLDALRDETAVDANNFAAQLAPKLGDSVARAHGRSRTIVELYTTATRTERRGAGQWELTPATLRAQSIRLHLLGARQVLMHALYQTDGDDDDDRLFVNPRFDFAPGLNFEPWWPHHATIADETARLSAFLEDTAPLAPIALFYPLHTAWAEGPRHAHARHFGRWCEALAENGCDYMVIDEKSLIDAEIRDGRLHVNGLRFAALALPAVRILGSVRTTRILGEFVAAGGELWTSGDAPEGACDGSLSISSTAHLDTEPDAQMITQLLNRLPAQGPTISFSGKIGRHIASDREDFLRVVLFNEGNDADDLLISLGAGMEYEIWDAVKGTHTPIATATSLSITLEPQQLVCLRLRESPAASGAIAPLFKQPNPSRAVALDRGWTFRTSEGGDALAINVDEGWQVQGFANFSGIGLYRLTFDLDAAADIILDLPSVATAVTVRIDGRDAGMRCFPPFRIALGCLSAGPHDLELAVSNTAANRYYAGTPYAGSVWPDESGLTAAPRLLFYDPFSVKE
ncbi:hypothetical protein GA0061101_11634 [Rhizobium lusitanum]|jgi:hypothetical protein|uniref:Carbohydrate-binding protein n=2 Tax=Rhizobium/Agrobacterium group TaxID=227290 RepID=A0A1C3WRT4_9HYPH|nr:hypothetical protein GA0061101_11634 [Rhizobium lusitanum]